MPREPIKVEPVNLNVRDNRLNLAMDTDPPQPPRFFTSNILTRTLSQLMGQAGTNVKRIRCSEEGDLIVSPTGSAYTDGESAYLIPPGAGVHAYFTPVRPCFTVDLWVFLNDAEVVLEFGGGLTMVIPILKTNTYYSINARITRLGVVEAVPAAIPNVQVVGYR